MSMSESVTEFSEVLPPYFPRTTSSSVRVGGLVVMVGNYGGTDSATQGGRSERRTHEERRRNYDVTRWLPLRAVASRMTNVSLAVLTLYYHNCQFRVSINVKTTRFNARLIEG